MHEPTPVDLSPITRGVVPAGVQPREPEDPAQVGPYRILGRIGAGGMGLVFAAVDRGGACVAVKVIHAGYAADADFRARFAREVHLMRRVDGICAVPVLAADTEARRPWLATPYIAGSTLRDHVRERGPLSGGMLLGFATGIAEALDALHRAGVVHRDLKPVNVILSPEGPKVLDFGIARAVDESSLTGTGQLIGSPGWISPEQYRGEAAGAPADVFAWGALVAYAATGRPPFGAAAVDVLAFRVLQDPPDLGGLPAELYEPVVAAMDKDPARRPSAGQLLARLTGGWQGGAESPTVVKGTQVLTRMLNSEWTSITLPQARTHPARYERLPTGPQQAGPRSGRAPTAKLAVAGLGVLLLVVAGGAGAGLLTRDTADRGDQGAPTADNGSPTPSRTSPDIPALDNADEQQSESADTFQGVDEEIETRMVYFAGDLVPGGPRPEHPHAVPIIAAVPGDEYGQPISGEFNSDTDRLITDPNALSEWAVVASDAKISCVAACLPDSATYDGSHHDSNANEFGIVVGSDFMRVAAEIECVQRPGSPLLITEIREIFQP